MAKYRVTFKSGEVYTTDLDTKEMIKRMNRLDLLRVATEQLQDNPVYRNIYKKAEAAYNKYENFTGIVRLTQYEKENLAYLPHEYMSDEELNAIKFYMGNIDFVD